MIDSESTEHLLKEFFWRARDKQGYVDYRDLNDDQIIHELSVRLDGVRR